MMQTETTDTRDRRPSETARDLQTRLYREIGISAVAAALRFTTQPETGRLQPTPQNIRHPGGKAA